MVCAYSGIYIYIYMPVCAGIHILVINVCKHIPIYKCTWNVSEYLYDSIKSIKLNFDTIQTAKFYFLPFFWAVLQKILSFLSLEKDCYPTSNQCLHLALTKPTLHQPNSTHSWLSEYCLCWRKWIERLYGKKWIKKNLAVVVGV